MPSRASTAVPDFAREGLTPAHRSKTVPRSHDNPTPSVYHSLRQNCRLTSSQLGTLPVLAAATPLVVSFPMARLLIAALVAAAGVALAVSYACVLLAPDLAAGVARFYRRATLPAFTLRRPSHSTDEAPE